MALQKSAILNTINVSHWRLLKFDKRSIIFKTRTGSRQCGRKSETELLLLLLLLVRPELKLEYTRYQCGNYFILFLFFIRSLCHASCSRSVDLQKEKNNYDKTTTTTINDNYNQCKYVYMSNIILLPVDRQIRWFSNTDFRIDGNKKSRRPSLDKYRSRKCVQVLVNNISKRDLSLLT